jgi:hypothetical protein
MIADVIEGMAVDGEGHPRLAADHRPARTDFESVQLLTAQPSPSR